MSVATSTSTVEVGATGLATAPVCCDDDDECGVGGADGGCEFDGRRLRRRRLLGRLSEREWLGVGAWLLRDWLGWWRCCDLIWMIQGVKERGLCFLVFVVILVGLSSWQREGGIEVSIYPSLDK